VRWVLESEQANEAQFQCNPLADVTRENVYVTLQVRLGVSATTVRTDFNLIL